MLALYYENMNLPITSCQAVYLGSSKNTTTLESNQYINVNELGRKLVGNNFFLFSEQADQHYVQSITIPSLFKSF